MRTTRTAIDPLRIIEGVRIVRTPRTAALFIETVVRPNAGDEVAAGVYRYVRGMVDGPIEDRRQRWRSIWLREMPDLDSIDMSLVVLEEGDMADVGYWMTMMVEFASRLSIARVGSRLRSPE